MKFVAFWTVEDAGPYELVRVRRECAVGYAVRTQSFSNAKQLSERIGLVVPSRLREPSEPAVRVDRLCTN